MRKLTTEEFVVKAKAVHNDKYDYSLVKYKGSKVLVKIICPTHGEFLQVPNSHLNGNGCRKCSGNNYKKTTEEFILEAKKIHNNKYDYSLVEYKNNHTLVKIICKEHGAFEQVPSSHLQNHGCPECSGNNHKKTTEEFILEAKKIHNNKYDYSMVNYINSKTKIKIICKEHGVFEQVSSNHLQGQGCPRCAGIQKLDNYSFIERANKVHSNKYDYNLVEYIDSKTKVKIICSTHGIFLQKPSNHLQRQGCPKCAGIQKLDNYSFIERAKFIHGGKYDYSLIDYKNTETKIKIICSIHGEFLQKPSNHLTGQGCPSCTKNKKLTTEEFIARSKKIHNNKYDYSLVEYKNNHTLVKIICLTHGVFEQQPQAHFIGSGCPVCNNSRGESVIFNYLTENNISFETEKKFQLLGQKRFDFYIEELNMIIEYDGIQHFKPVKFFGKESFRQTQINDKIKNEFCKEQGINLLRIPYTEFNSIEKTLDKILLKC